MNEQKKSGAALIPFLVFIVSYLGAGIIYQMQGESMAFYMFPSVTAMFFAAIVAFCMGKGSINQKFEVFAKGAANVDILTMLIIYILAGAFANVAATMGAKDATVNLGLRLVPPSLLAAGLFVIAAFFGTATGTSMGTISALIPIAIGVADKGNLSPTIVIAAVVGGGMFGDNLSMISDTTIAATRTQRVEMRDKFRVNFMIALPAAVMSRKMPKMKIGSSGTSAPEIVRTTTPRKSENTRLRASHSAKTMPSPAMNENTSALITSMIGGIDICTYGWNSSAAPSTAWPTPVETSDGKAAAETKYPRNPAKSVDP